MPNSLKSRLKKLEHQGLLSEKDLSRIVVIPDNATNGDMIKALFGFEPRKNTCIIPKKLCNGNPAECDGCRFNDWWDALYKKGEQ